MAIISQRKIMDECWDGERERNCDYCPAHHSKNGDCCFGLRYEYGDPPCMECPHRDDCSVLTRQTTDEYQTQQAPRRVTVSRNQPAQSRSKIYPPSQTAEGVLRVRTAEPQPILVPEEASFLKKVGLHAAWGAVEGALELLLTFFRRRRPD